VASPQGPFYKELGKKIAAARRIRAGLTQARLAAAVGLSRASIVNIEAGRQPVAVHHLVMIAAQLGLSVGDLIPRASPMPVFGGLKLPAHLDDEERAFAMRILAPQEEPNDS
jgi:transcriptional regulator with XRE-family HTH domain